MSARLEFHFDFGSPNAYLSHRVLPALEARIGERFDYVPVLLGGVFKATGNVSPAVSMQGIKNKPAYQALEIKRFCQRHGIDDFRRNPHFPVNTLQIMRGALAAQREDCFERYVDVMYRNMWSTPKKLDEPEVIRSVLEESDLPTDAILTGAQDPDIKARLIANTNDAVDRGVFGSPSFFVGDALFFGKDSLGEVEAEAKTRGSAH